ncbi:hypothetical protein [Streptomyces sp. 5-10]|uniref:hypothetical protein n=1 Tax=Streptomyces sp. 5-10 TaxID=878925 RepID=UPI00168B3E73|nr:hypothetical protein [Streptomyces sp. 5-10]MBD3004800.1 hypothetical protein [Streptomyces sp. 5-10]
MNVPAVRKNLMLGVATFGTASLTAGILLGHAPLIVVGLMTLITFFLWLYGQSLAKD